jgi:adenylate cyclase
VLKTERLRIIALIVVATALVVGLGAVDLLMPAVLDRNWHRQLTGYVAFVLFEASVLVVITRRIKRGGDVPQLRRYVGALYETSLPSVVIATQMSDIGAAQALAFVGPLLYFIFIILSTLRLDFWLSAFTGIVAGAELLGLAFLHPSTQTAASDPTLATRFVISRSAVIVACGVIAGAVGTRLRWQFEASITAAIARDHVTNLFGQHVSPQVVERLLAAGPTAAAWN